MTEYIIISAILLENYFCEYLLGKITWSVYPPPSKKKKKKKRNRRRNLILSSIPWIRMRLFFFFSGEWNTANENKIDPSKFLLHFLAAEDQICLWHFAWRACSLTSKWFTAHGLGGPNCLLIWTTIRSLDKSRFVESHSQWDKISLCYGHRCRWCV